MLLLCHFLADFDSDCLFYLIGLGAGFCFIKTSTQNFEIN